MKRSEIAPVGKRRAVAAQESGERIYSTLQPAGGPRRLSATKRVGGKLRNRSTKGAAEERKRGNLLREMFPEGEGRGCTVPGCGREANDAHERLTRGRGGSASDPENIVPLCRRHHDEVHAEEPLWAYELGILIHSWEAS